MTVPTIQFLANHVLFDTQLRPIPTIAMNENCCCEIEGPACSIFTSAYPQDGSLFNLKIGVFSVTAIDPTCTSWCDGLNAEFTIVCSIHTINYIVYCDELGQAFGITVAQLEGMGNTQLTPPCGGDIDVWLESHLFIERICPAPELLPYVFFSYLRLARADGIIYTTTGGGSSGPDCVYADYLYVCGAEDSVDAPYRMAQIDWVCGEWEIPETMCCTTGNIILGPSS